MRPLDAIFGAAVDIRNRLYDQRRLLVHRLQGPVVSIGNISVGGTGKTPFLILLGELLHQRGVAFDVLSRGYRRQSKGVALVDPQGSPEQYGDEPLLIARNSAYRSSSARNATKLDDSQNGSSVRNFTCWMTASSTGAWPATSTSCCSHRTTFATG